MKYFLHRSNLWIYFRLLSKSSKNLPEAETSINQNVLNTHCSTGLSAPSFPPSSIFASAIRSTTSSETHLQLRQLHLMVLRCIDSALLESLLMMTEERSHFWKSFCTKLHLQWQQELLILSMSPATGPQGNSQELTLGWWIPSSGDGGRNSSTRGSMNLTQAPALSPPCSSFSFHCRCGVRLIRMLGDRRHFSMG